MTLEKDNNKVELIIANIISSLINSKLIKKELFIAKIQKPL
jgi:hypothetical protein